MKLDLPIVLGLGDTTGAPSLKKLNRPSPMGARTSKGGEL